MMWSIACIAKLKVMNSTIGFSPPIAAPAPRPAKPYSVIGVSTTRRGAEFLEQALRHLVGALIFGDLLADHEHPLVGAHLLGHGIAQCLAHGGRLDRGAGGHLGLVPRGRGIVDQVARRGFHLLGLGQVLGLLRGRTLDPLSPRARATQPQAERGEATSRRHRP